MGQRVLGTEKKAGSTFQWVSKVKLEEVWGKAKTAARLERNVVERRADPLTGLDDDENAEYKLVIDGGEDMDV